MVHLHTHSMYSLRDSIIRPEDLIERLKEIGQDTVAITDHGGSLGGVTLYQTLKKAGIRYIHGCEFYICFDVSVKDKDSKYYHLVALCKNETGRQNLNKLISISERPENRYFKPRIDFDLLSKYGDGLIIMSACLAGEISRAILDGDISAAVKTAIRYRARFGPDYYLEIQAHNDPQQISVNREIIKIAKQLGIPCVVTTDAHYTWEADRKYQIKYAFNGSYKEDGEAYIDCFIQSEQEVRDRLFYLDADTVDELIRNTHMIAEKCQMEIPLSAPIMPKVDTPPEFQSNHDWLVSLCTDGFRRKLNIDPVARSNVSQDGLQHDLDTINAYVDRYEYELNALDKMGFVDYILLVYSYASVGKRRGIARGSGGGSLINYLTDITNIDPIEHGLYFERFIDVSALSKLESGEITAKELKIPDIDLDFSKDSCDEVLKFLYQKYGEDKVASIGKFGTNQTKGTIRDMCKVLGIGLNEADRIAKSFESYEIDEIDRMISGELPTPESAKEAVACVKSYRELFEYVRKLNGLPKSFGLHACFSGDTLITTDHGQIAISDIKTGDLVLTKNGRYGKVIQTSKLQSDNIVQVDISGAPNIVCTADHLFLVRKRLHCKKHIFSDPMWVAASEIKKSDVVAMAQNQNSSIAPGEKLNTQSNDFWWVIGRYIGDGWTEAPKERNERRVIICCSKNGTLEIESICIHLIRAGFKFRTEEANTVYKIHILDPELYSFLLQFGKYAFGKHLTSTIQNLPVELLKSFLDGYFSADGYIDKKGFQNFKTVSKGLAIDIKQAVAKAYNRHSGICIIPQKTEVICGREVNSKEKYTCYFSANQREKERCFYEYPYVWAFVNDVSKLDQEIDVYDLTVNEDSSFVANGVVVHNCGKIVATRDLDYYLPSCYDSNGIRYLQGDMHDVEDMGLVKIDVLGLRTLDAEYDTLEQSGEGPEFLDPKQDYSDEKVLSIFRKGDTVGIFQMASPGMKKTLRNMDVSGIEDLSAANALFRPGSIQYIDNYCRRKAGEERFEYLHPDLEPILKNTYGIIVFQEQLIEIGRMAGLHNPDQLRKATGKKNPALLAEVQPELHEKLLARGWSEAQFDKLWSDMLEFARYSFNKCVAASTRIQRAGQGSKWWPTVEEMWKIKNDLTYSNSVGKQPLRSKYLRGYGYALSMFPDNRIRKNKIVDIFQSGIRDVWEVKTESGASIVCTDNHRFPTPNGYRKLSELNAGDLLFVKGTYEKTKIKYNFTNGEFKRNIPKPGEKGFQRIEDGESVKFYTVREEKRIAKCACEECGKPYRDSGRFELHHRDRDRKNNDFGNLVWVCNSCHKKLEYAAGRRKVYEKGIPTTLSKIVSIEYMGKQMTYDIEMENPAHTFISETGLVTSNSHSSAYAIIAYMTAKQKAYYPAEFYCGLCNSYIGKPDFVKSEANEIIGDMMRHGIRIAPANFRNDHRRCNVKDGKVLWGIPLIRDCNTALGEALYELRDTRQEHFWRVAKILGDKGMKSKVEILVKLGFFHEYGTAKELLRVLDLAEMFKMGDRKSIKKAAIAGNEFMENTLKKYASSTNAKGEELSTYKILDCGSILDECEDHIKTLYLGDFDNKAMLLTQREYIGALAIPTGNRADRRRLFVNSVFPLNRKSDGKLFGYNVAYTSIGSGVTNSMTVFLERFQKLPVSPGDIILCKDYVKDKKGYFRMLDYEKCY